MAGSSLVSSHQHKNGKARPARRASHKIEMPKLTSLRDDMDPVEARRLELWGLRIVADIAAFRHRQMRRREGVW